MKNNLGLALIATLLTGLAAGKVHGQTILLNDDFTGDAGDIQTVTTPSGMSGDDYTGLTLNSGKLTYNEYIAQSNEDSSTYTLGDEAGVGPNGADGLVYSLSPTTGQEFSGINTSGVQTTFTPGAVTVADLQSLQISYDFTLAGSYGLNFYVNAATETGGGFNGSQSFQNFTGGNGSDTGGNFEHMVFSLDSESVANLQTFADALNSQNSNVITLQVASTFNSNDPKTESETVSNLVVEETPEPSTWGMVGLGALLFVGFLRHRETPFRF